jgi:hypothetical protein
VVPGGQGTRAKETVTPKGQFNEGVDAKKASNKNVG